MSALPRDEGARHSSRCVASRSDLRVLAELRGSRVVEQARGNLFEVDDYVACKMLWHVLSVKTLPSLSRVCRQFSRLTLHAESWARKDIVIAHLSIDEPALRKCCAAWHLAQIAMTFAQKDVLAGAPLRTHLIQHPWQFDGSRNPWTRIVAESSGQWLACLTMHRGPETARVVQRSEVRGLSQHVETPVCLGWTSAAYPSGLAIMSDRYAEGRNLPGDFIFCLPLIPFGHRPHVGRLIRMHGEAPNAHQAVFFDELAAVVASARLDRARRAIEFETEWEEGTCVFPGAPIPDHVELKFFVATELDRARDLPRTRLPRLWLDWTVLDSQRASPSA